jgi:hypothetical protein
MFICCVKDQKEKTAQRKKINEAEIKVKKIPAMMI